MFSRIACGVCSLVAALTFTVALPGVEALAAEKEPATAPAKTSPAQTPPAKTAPAKTTKTTPAKKSDKAAPAKEAPAKTTKAAPSKKSDKAAPSKKSDKAAPANKAASKTPETPDQIEVKLISFAKTHLDRANATLRPNRANPEFRNEDGMVIARFLEVDVTSLSTEMTPSTSPGCLYVGHVIYHERIYEARAASKAEAAKAQFSHVKTRRITELTRYDNGKWHY